MSLNRSNWPRCLLWHDWLPGLGLCGERDPWAASLGQLASCELERCLGAHPAHNSGFLTTPDHCDADDFALEMTDEPNFWTDGSREIIALVGLRLLALGCICLLLSWLWKVQFERWRGVWRRWVGALLGFYASPWAASNCPKV